MAVIEINTDGGSIDRLLEALEMQSPTILIESRARQVLRDAATHVLYDVEESNRVVLDSVHTMLTLFATIGNSCFGGAL